MFDRIEHTFGSLPCIYLENNIQALLAHLDDSYVGGENSKNLFLDALCCADQTEQTREILNQQQKVVPDKLQVAIRNSYSRPRTDHHGSKNGMVVLLGIEKHLTRLFVLCVLRVDQYVQSYIIKQIRLFVDAQSRPNR